MPRRFQFSLRALLVLVTVSAVPFVWWSYEPHRLVYKLRNSDIDWDGTVFGLLPNLRGEAASSLLRTGRRATPLLVEALEDREKFAAAHVVLTFLWEERYPGGADEWNHLRVTLYSDGTTVVYDEQIPELRRYWRTKLE